MWIYHFQNQTYIGEKKGQRLSRSDHSSIVNGDFVFTRHEFYNSFTVTWLSEFRAPAEPPRHIRGFDTRVCVCVCVQVALLVLFPGMHNARRGEFTLPMANRKSSANIRQETFFEPERLSPFLEKCVDEKYCTGSQEIVKNSLGDRCGVHSFTSADICG